MSVVVVIVRLTIPLPLSPVESPSPIALGLARAINYQGTIYRKVLNSYFALSNLWRVFSVPKLRRKEQWPADKQMSINSITEVNLVKTLLDCPVT